MVKDVIVPYLAGLPAIVARNTMKDSKSESVVLPLVGRNVQNLDAALSASNSEGADFLMCGFREGQKADLVGNSVFTNVKIPIFVMNASHGEAKSLAEMSKCLKSGASGFVISLKNLRLFSGDVLSQLFNAIRTTNEKLDRELENASNVKLLDAGDSFPVKESVAGFVKLENREKQLIETERSVLLEAIDVIQKAAPLVILY